MRTLLTATERAATPTDDTRVGEFGDDAVGSVLAAIHSETAREMLLSVRDEPLTASEIADRVDTSVQNASYHLRKLVDAELVRICDNVYSEKGCEMKCYRAVDTALLLTTESR